MDDLDLVLKALGTQLKPIIKIISKQPQSEQAKSYAKAITILAKMAMAGPNTNNSVKLGIAVALTRMGAHKSSVAEAARLVGALDPKMETSNA